MSSICVKGLDEGLVHRKLVIVPAHPGQGADKHHWYQEYNLLSKLCHVVSGSRQWWLWSGVGRCQGTNSSSFHSIPSELACPGRSDRPGPCLACSLLSPQLLAQGLETCRMGFWSE